MAGGAAAQTPGGSAAPNKKRKARGRLECELGSLLGAGGLIGSRLGQLWIAFDVFSQFTLQFVLLTAAFVIGFLMPRAKLLVAFLIIIAGLAGIGVWPHLASRVPITLGSAAAGEKDIRVASFNTWYSNQNVGAVQAEIERLDADVITLLELGI